MSTPRISFYDHHRQHYHDAVWDITRRGRDDIVGRFMVGDYYVREGGVGPRGELAICLYDFKRSGPWTPEHFYNQPLSARVEAFADSFGTLRALDRLGVLRALARAQLWTRDDLTALLVKKGLADRSDVGLDTPTST